MNPVFRVARLQWRDRAGFSPASLLMPNIGTREHYACKSDAAKGQVRSVRAKCRARFVLRPPSSHLRAVDPLVEMRDLRFR